MKLTWDIKKIEDLDKNVSSAVQFILDKVSQNVLTNYAKVNAPYRSGDLRSSIGRDTRQIQQWIVIVWSPLPYARIREYVNNLHPNTKYYLWRAYSEHIPDIKQEIITSLSDKLK